MRTLIVFQIFLEAKESSNLREGVSDFEEFVVIYQTICDLFNFYFF